MLESNYCYAIFLEQRLGLGGARGAGVQAFISKVGIDWSAQGSLWKAASPYVICQVGMHPVHLKSP